MPDKEHLHPLLKVREQYRQIFLEMGFSEMPTSEYVEGSFWNFDALFVPQKLSAQEVSKVHTTGGYGSKGYEADW